MKFLSSFHVRLFAFWLVMVCPCLSTRAETNPVPAWSQPLIDLGLSLDTERVRAATTLAAIQTADPRAGYISPDAWASRQQQNSGWVYRANVKLTMSNSLPVVTESFTTNLAAGDIIIRVGTNRLENLTLPSAVRVLSADTSVTNEIEFARGDVTNVISFVFESRTQFPLETAELLAGEIAYIKVNGFFASAGPSVFDQVSIWATNGATGLILDLRDSGGDDAAAVARVASLFYPEGQFLFAYRNLRNEELSSWKSEAAPKLEIPVMVLVDAGTRGASEVLAALLHHGLTNTLLVGETTAGDFGLREAVNIGDQLILMVTRVLDTEDGYRYNGQSGVEPAIVVDPHGPVAAYEPTVDQLDRRTRSSLEERHAAMRQRTRGDAALELALDLITALKALNQRPAEVSLLAP